ncbi:hypothetical protein RUM43_006230 [Polyplax serrata]|uniref:Uncharacterized protein n=1 Tax=Polyplax serrata TaxID=468196 RepID=A0AAN8RV88_POLSC
MEKRFRGKVEMENLKIEGEWKIKSYFCKGREEKAAVGLRQKWETDKQKEQKGWQKGTTGRNVTERCRSSKYRSSKIGYANCACRRLRNSDEYKGLTVKST